MGVPLKTSRDKNGRLMIGWVISRGAQKTVLSRVKEPQGHPFIRPFVGTVYLTPFITIVSQVGLTQRLKPDRFWMVLEDCRSAPESFGYGQTKPRVGDSFVIDLGVIGYIPSQKKRRWKMMIFRLAKHPGATCSFMFR